MDKWVKNKIEAKTRICSKCYNEKVWDNRYCPDCQNDRYIPYYPNPASKISCINPAIL